MNPYLYEERETIIHRLDPRVKLFLLIAAFFIMLIPSLLPSALGSFALIAVHASLARAWDAIRRLRNFIIVITIFTIILWIMIPRGEDILWLFIRRDSFMHGVLAAVKIAGILIAGMIFLVTTRNEEITAGLVRLGAPYVACFAFSLALRLVPTFAQTGLTVAEAQKSRGLELRKGPLWQRMKNYIPLMAPIFLVSIRNANLMAMALEARGFGARGKRTFYLQVCMKQRDWLALAVGSLTLLLLFGIHLV